MKTKIFYSPSREAVEETGRILAEGGIAAFPTETVYGLGANAFDENAVRKIFKAKGRPSDNPLIVHTAGVSDAEDFAYITPEARMLMDRFCPGPLTVILKKKNGLAQSVTAGLDTVGVRCPSHPVARDVIRAAGVPIAAPSANISGRPSPTNIEDVIFDMDGRADAIINGGACGVGVESTIVDMTGEAPVILRPGGITADMIREVFSCASVDKNVLQTLKPDEVPKCPGMKYKHYAPNADVTVIEGSRLSVRERICGLLKNKTKKTGVMRMFEGEYPDADLVLDAGRDNKEYAKNLFSCLRSFDKAGIEVVYAEFEDEDGYGLAVKNRLYKSAGYKIIRV